MESDWKEYRLEDCMDAIIDYRGKTPKKTDSGIPLITAKIIKNGRIMPVSEYIAEEDYDAWMRRGIPKPGDIVLTTEAPLGEVAQLDNRKIALAQRVITLRGKEGVLDNTFLKYLLLSNYVQHQLDGRGTGTTVKGIKQSELREVKLKFPAFHTQQKIGHILGTVDDKIELNRQTNQTLEQMAQALFKSWFVDFDPVIDNALAAGNPIPPELEARAEGRKSLQARADRRAELARSGNAPQLPDHIRTLFPDRFTHHPDMGWVPEGWEIVPLDNLIGISHGYAFKGEFFSATPTNDILLTPGNFKVGGGFKGEKFKYYNGPIPEDYILYHNDLIITMTDLSKAGDTLGYPALVPDNENYCYLHNQRLGRVNYKTDLVGKEFIYRCLTTKEYRDEVLASASGSTVKHTAPKKILAHKIAYSKGKVEPIFENLCRQLTEKSSLNESNSLNLTKLRDTLLPKLISGELRIPDICVHGQV